MYEEEPEGKQAWKLSPMGHRGSDFGMYALGLLEGADHEGKAEITYAGSDKRLAKDSKSKNRKILDDYNLEPGKIPTEFRLNMPANLIKRYTKFKTINEFYLNIHKMFGVNKITPYSQR